MGPEGLSPGVWIVVVVALGFAAVVLGWAAARLFLRAARGSGDQDR